MLKYAEILVECGYAVEILEAPINGNPNHIGWCCRTPENVGKTQEWRSVVDPFADTLTGRRQADAIEDFLPFSLWEESYLEVDTDHGDGRKLKLDRIKWCVEQLEKDE